jgi:DnaK suppressor protein
MELHTQTHLPMLRQLLTYRQIELRAEVHAAQMAREQAAGAAHEVKDQKDDAEALQRQRTDDHQLERDLAELRAIDSALGRLDTGTYGDCADCGEPIPVARLMSQPAAECCAPCQSQREQQRR